MQEKAQLVIQIESSIMFTLRHSMELLPLCLMMHPILKQRTPETANNAVNVLQPGEEAIIPVSVQVPPRALKKQTHFCVSVFYAQWDLKNQMQRG